MVRQMLTESMLLSLIGGAAGIATAVGTLGFILRFVPSNIPRLNEVRIDWVVLAFALLISILTGLVFGLAPAFHSARVTLSSAIREGGRGSGYSTKTGRLRDVLIVSELAFAVILMVGAGLLLRTLRNLLQENPGFNPAHVVTANLELPNPNESATDPYRDVPRRAAFERELLRRMKEIPGVELPSLQLYRAPIPTPTRSVASRMKALRLKTDRTSPCRICALREFESAPIISRCYRPHFYAAAPSPRTMKTANRWWPSLMSAPLISIGQTAIRWAAECGSGETPASHGRPSWVL
jgi:hypothetical protein